MKVQLYNLRFSAYEGSTTMTEFKPIDDVEQTVAFHDDKVPITTSFDNPLTVDRELQLSLREERVHTITDFLSRPIELLSGLWSTTDAIAAQLTTLSVPSALLSSSMYAAKASGFLGFKATTVVRLQVNAQRFQQGRLLLHYLPMVAPMPSRMAQANYNLTYMTQHPRVELDACCDTDVVLRIPFVYPFEYFNMLDQIDAGSFFVHVYSPLVSPSGTTNANWSLWGYFEDVELVYPTAQCEDIFFAQAGGSVTMRAKRVDIPSSELMAAGSGPISSILNRVSKSATILSEIPLLSAVTAPAAWVAGVLSRATSALGWSNPSSSAPCNKVIPYRYGFSNNCNGIDNSLKLGMFADNSVQVLPGFGGTDNDELYIQHVCSIPAFVGNYSWASTMTRGTLLFSQVIVPSSFAVSQNISSGLGTIAVRHPTPFAYVANLFRYWRGSVVLTIKVVKTEFHSGRIQVSWLPGTTVAPAFGTAYNMLYKEILDLRTANEFSVTIPFTSVKPWRLTTSTAGLDLGIGIVTFHVLNPLRAPDTAAQSVQLLLEINAGSDIEFAAPTEPIQLPVYLAQAEDVFLAQGGDLGCGVVNSTVSTQGGFQPPVIASSSIEDGFLSAAKYCIGETICSLRQLLHRATVCVSYTAAGPTVLAVRPWFIYVPTFTAGFPIVSRANCAVDYVSYIGSMYAFSRGGMRMRIVPISATAAIVAARLRKDTNAINVAPFWDATTDSTTPGPMNYASTTVTMTGGLEVEVPQYTQLHKRINTTYYGIDNGGVTQFDDTNDVLFHTTSASPGWRMLRQTSEDADMGFFVGAMPLVNSSEITPVQVLC